MMQMTTCQKIISRRISKIFSHRPRKPGVALSVLTGTRVLTASLSMVVLLVQVPVAGVHYSNVKRKRRKQQHAQVVEPPRLVMLVVRCGRQHSPKRWVTR